MISERPLTDKQREVLEAIVAYIPGHGRPPTVRELAAIIGKQVSTTAQHVKALRKKGCLVYGDHHIALVPGVEQSSPTSEVDSGAD